MFPAELARGEAASEFEILPLSHGYNTNKAVSTGTDPIAGSVIARGIVGTTKTTDRRTAKTEVPIHTEQMGSNRGGARKGQYGAPTPGEPTFDAPDVAAHETNADLLNVGASRNKTPVESQYHLPTRAAVSNNRLSGARVSRQIETDAVDGSGGVPGIACDHAGRIV